LRYRENTIVNGRVERKYKIVKLAEYSEGKYRTKSSLADLVAQEMATVRQVAKCPKAGSGFVDYVDGTWFPNIKEKVALGKMAPSTQRCYATYWKRYLKPRVEHLALRDFTVAVITNLLADIAGTHKLNTETVIKVRSILSGIFTFAIQHGDFPATSVAENPASRAAIPDSAAEPQETVAATREEVQGYLAALNGQPLERAAVALSAYLGTRPSETFGLRWEDWNRDLQHIAVKRAVWHGIVGDLKTDGSERFVVVTDELRTILNTLHKTQGSPTGGFILAASNGHPSNRDNMSKRAIRAALNRCEVCHEPEDAKHVGHAYKRDATLPVWHSWYGLRRFLGTQVRMNSNTSETPAKALGNTREVCDKHYIKATDVLPEVRRAQTAATLGLSVAS
jgi:integrase